MKDVHFMDLFHYFLATKGNYDFKDRESKQTEGLTF